MNLLNIAGVIGKDAETRVTPNGKEVTSFSVAVKDGPEKTLWVDCSIWGDRGLKLAPFLMKGGRVAVCGNATVRAYEKDGEARAVLGIRVIDVTLQGDGGGEKQQRQAAPQRQQPAQARSAQAQADQFEDDDIPY